MKQIKDNSLFADEFQRLINSKKYTDMIIDTNETSTIIRLEEQSNTASQQKRDMLLKTLDGTAGILKDYPRAAKDLHAIARREDEDDREDTQIG
jgi:hypothetical protein